MIDDYLNVLSTKKVSLPEGYHDVVAAAEPVKQVLAQADTPLAPCHCDPLCENFLDDGKIMWIVDWEYSGMNDPLWDLGDLSVEARMDAGQDAEMMAVYFGRLPTEAEQGRLVIYKAVCDLLWTLWGLIQLNLNHLIALLIFFYFLSCRNQNKERCLILNQCIGIFLILVQLDTTYKGI